MQEIANVHGHYERLKKSSVPTSSGVTLLNLTDLLRKCTFEYQQWQQKTTVSWWTCNTMHWLVFISECPWSVFFFFKLFLKKSFFFSSVYIGLTVLLVCIISFVLRLQRIKTLKRKPPRNQRWVKPCLELYIKYLSYGYKKGVWIYRN